VPGNPRFFLFWARAFVTKGGSFVPAIEDRASIEDDPEHKFSINLNIGGEKRERDNKRKDKTI
jgi:hypothetical protein